MTPIRVRLLALLAIATVVLYLPLLAAGFAWDDEALIPAIAARPASEAWSHGLWPGSEGEARGIILYRPALEMVLKATATAGGGSPLLFHAVSIALHVLVGLGFLCWLWRRDDEGGRGREALWGSTLVASAYLLHPAHQEAVAFVSGQNDLWAALAVVGAAWAAERSSLLAGLVLLVGLAFKESAVVGVILVGGDLLVRGRGPRTAVALVAATTLWIGIRLVMASPPNLPVPTFMQGAAMFAHAGSLLVGASAVHVHQPLSLVFADTIRWATGTAAIVALVATTLARTDGRLGLAAWITGLLLALPVAVTVDNYGDRYFNIPDLGLALALAGPAACLVGWRPGRWIAAAALAGWLLLNVTSLSRWASSTSLWDWGLDHDPTGYSAWQLGAYHEGAGRLEQAEAAYAQALDARYPYPVAFAGLGRLRVLRGDLAGGCQSLARAHSLDSDGKAYLARCLAAAGTPGPAAKLLDEAQAEDPTNPLVLLEQLALAVETGDVAREHTARSDLARVGVDDAAATILLAARRRGLQ